MPVYQVGKPYSPSRRTWGEGADYNFRAGEHELRIFLANASGDEVAAGSRGTVRFGLLVDRPELYLISRFFHPRDKTRQVMSFDCSYSIHRVAPDERQPPPAWEEVNPALRPLLSIILVEATNGLILALRAVTFEPEFGRVLHRAIAEQLALPFDPAAHARRTAEMVRTHDTAALWRLCSIRCTGGA
jgi:hypothetical protein